MGMQEMPMSQKVFLAQFDTIKKLADEGPCVIIVGDICGILGENITDYLVYGVIALNHEGVIHG